MMKTSVSVLAFRAVISIALAVAVATPCVAQSSETAGLLETAANGTGQARYTAIDDLGERHEDADAVVAALIKLLKDSDPLVRWRSARALGDYGSQAQSAAPELRSLLAEKDPIVQYHAAATLGKIDDRSDETINALVGAVTSSDGRIARVAIAALRSLEPGPERVMAALERALQSDDQAVLAYVLEALIERGEKAVPVLNAALKQPKTAYLACAAIEQIGPKAAGTVPALTELLGKTKHSHLLIQSLLALASIGPEAKSAAPQIAPLLESTTDSTVPVAAAYALGAIGAEEADAALQRAMENPDPFLQMVVAWSLAKLHPEDAQLKQQALEKLNAGLKSEDPSIRAAAEKGLTLLQPPASEDASQ